MKALLPILAFLLLSLSALAGEWMHDVSAARQLAQEKGLDILVLHEGDEFKQEQGSPAPLFDSPFFKNRAEQLGFVLVRQPSNFIENIDGKKYVKTHVMFMDARGCPYYGYEEEWQSGLDWICEEMLIARERRGVVMPIWEELFANEDGTAQPALAARIFLTLPWGSVNCDGYCQLLHSEALEHDSAYRAICEERDAYIKPSYEEVNHFYRMSESEEGSREIRDGLFVVPEELKEARPNLYVYLHLLCEAHRHLVRPLGRDRNESERLSASLMYSAVLRCMALAPRCKMARQLRVVIAPHIMTIITLQGVSDFRLKPQVSLETLRHFESTHENSLYGQLGIKVMIARILAELGRFDESLRELENIELYAPMRDYAQEAIKLRETILTRRERLEELFPLIRKGHAALDEEWDSLLSVPILSVNLALYIEDNYLHCESEAQVEETLKKAREQEVLDKEKLRSFVESVCRYIGITPAGLEEGVAFADVLAQAEQENLEAQKRLFWLYYEGKSAPYDIRKSFFWLHRAAEQGAAEAQYAVGLCYLRNYKVRRDDHEALRWLQLAAEGGMAIAQYDLACNYLELGSILEKSAADALELLEKSAQQGYALAQDRLAYIYYQGKLVERDINRAYELGRMAALQGVADSQYLLGYLYSCGIGVEKDTLQAAYWFRKAAEQGHQQAAVSYENITRGSYSSGY